MSSGATGPPSISDHTGNRFAVGGQGQHDHRFRIRQHVRQALPRIGQVHRQVHGTGLHHTEHRDNQFQGTGHAQRDPVTRLDAKAQEVVRHLVGATVELAVTQRGIAARDRDRTRIVSHLRLEHSQDC
ncbi:MAG TPA: hypothetical protein VK827_05150 [Lysobacter sp.]|nr:hypothetical protein [Lysobacter sp.]